jgi:hypothetical protein
VGTDSEVGLLTAALNQSADSWQDTGLVLEVADSQLAMFDSAADGRDPEECGAEVARMSVPAGSYAVDFIEEWEVDVEIDEGWEGVMVQLVRFRRI